MGNPLTAAHIVIMGVSGTGKTTVATAIRDLTHRSFAEADDFHPQANVAKMQAGIPLTDEDREPWLHSLRDWMSEEYDAGRSTVITCSALKRAYRDILRTAHGPVVFAHLEGPVDLIADRMKNRPGHFMPPSLLPSQLESLEVLEPGEDGRTYTITGDPLLIAKTIAADYPAS
jgi:gluconokinase